MSEQWVAVAKLIRGIPEVDQRNHAKELLKKTIDDIEGNEATVRGELVAISRKVRQMDRSSMKNATMHHLKRSRYLRQQLGLLSSKRGALEQHLDTLSTSELNQQVISSVKLTSSALKSMGLDVAQSQADGLVIDMEERMADMHSIQKTLSTPMTEDYDDDFGALDEELDLLLMENEEEITSTVHISSHSGHVASHGGHVASHGGGAANTTTVVALTPVVNSMDGPITDEARQESLVTET